MLVSSQLAALPTAAFATSVVPPVAASGVKSLKENDSTNGGVSTCMPAANSSEEGDSNCISFESGAPLLALRAKLPISERARGASCLWGVTDAAATVCRGGPSFDAGVGLGVELGVGHEGVELSDEREGVECRNEEFNAECAKAPVRRIC